MSHRPDGVDIVTEMNLNYSQRGKHQYALGQWLMDFVRPTDLFVTFAWNRTPSSKAYGTSAALRSDFRRLTVLQAHHDLDEFDKRIDKFSVGRKYHKKRDGRCVLIATPEHSSSNGHYHGALRPGRFPEGTDIRDYMAECRRIWKVVAPGGSIDIQIVGDNVFDAKKLDTCDHPEALRGPHRIARYIVKSAALPGAAEGLFVAGRLKPIG